MNITRAKYKNLCIKEMHKLINEYGYKIEQFTFSNGVKDDCPELEDLMHCEYKNNFTLLKGTPYIYERDSFDCCGGIDYCILSVIPNEKWYQECEERGDI